MSDSTRTRPVFVTWPVWLTYTVLFAVAIPWYWPVDDVRLFLGIPLWAAVSIGASVLVSVFTATLLIRYWPEQPEEPGPPDE